MKRTLAILGMVWAALSMVASDSEVAPVADLRLIPFPKEAIRAGEGFALNRRLILEVSQGQARVLGEQLAAELKLAGFPPLSIRPLKTALPVLRLSAKARWAIKKLPLRPGASSEEYVLQVQPHAVTISAAGPAGLYYGAQTLRQLIRANRQEDSLPGLAIRDWPSLTWRAYQDDLTRGPSSTLENLQLQAALGSFLKLNVFTYYMEHQFAFAKHPEIGPPDGSLTAPELKALVDFAQPLHLNVLGNQQSFGHFTAILAHPKYALLRETDYLLCPTNPQTYRLLDDLYSEVAPLLPFPFFNVCCDETEGLGTGPSKPIVQKLGAGAVYVDHVRRVHDLITQKYHKRMMMWGDIILRHQDQLNRIPKDTVLLTWGYDPRPSFDDQIKPFAQAGYPFFVCPGVSGWNRILPQFGTAAINIQNFVRDGVQQGAIGMLNTAWDDDGETFNAPNWPGFAWGAECAWNGSTTCLGDFNRRLGAVLFGQRGESFGRAIEILSVPGIEGLPNSTFWQFAFGPIKVRSAELARAQAENSLVLVRTAIAQLAVSQQEAKINDDLLDYFIFGANRIELCFQRELDRLQAAGLYRNARRLPLVQALPLLEQAEAALRSSCQAHERLGERYAELWHRENKPYALNWTLKRYRDLIAKYDVQIERLTRVRLNAKPDRSLPTPREVGLELVEESR